VPLRRAAGRENSLDIRLIEYILAGRESAKANGFVEREIIFTGIGGQGVQLAAKSLAYAAMREGRRVLMFGTYGGMMRGGDTDATVVLGQDSLVTPPVIDSAWAVVAMHHLSWGSVGPKLRPDGFLLTNEHVFTGEVDHPGRALAVAATRLATEAGTPQAGAMVALGSFAAATGIVALETLLAVAEEVLPPYRRQFAESNRRALALGHAQVERPMAPAWATPEPAL
jgi:2-oxoglutarate ferredoxin oxidoreductase subunit gamma